MRNTIKILSIAIFGLIILKACTDNTPPVGGPVVPPEQESVPQYPRLTLVDTTDVLFVDAALEPESIFNLLLRGTKGDSLLSTLVITANNEQLEASRLKINGSPSSEAVYNLTGGERDNFTWEIEIVAQSEEKRVIYEFRLEDETGRSSVTDILIDTKITPFTPPTISVVNDSVVSLLTELPVSFDFEVEALGAALNNVSIHQGAALIDAGRIQFDGQPVGNNPFFLEGDDRQGFSKPIEILGNDFNGIQAYTVTFTDTLGNTYFQEVSFDAIRRVDSQSYVLSELNALDIETGENILYTEELADDQISISEIRDISQNAGNWDRTVAATNGGELRMLNGQAIDFNNVVGADELREAWDNASTLVDFVTEYDSSMLRGVLQPDTLVIDTIEVPRTNPLQSDDLIITLKNNSYYLLRVDQLDASNREYNFEVKF